MNHMRSLLLNLLIIVLLKLLLHLFMYVIYLLLLWLLPSLFVLLYNIKLVLFMVHIRSWPVLLCMSITGWLPHLL